MGYDAAGYEGVDAQRKEYMYKRLIAARPDWANRADLMYDASQVELEFYRGINDGTIPDLAAYTSGILLSGAGIDPTNTKDSSAAIQAILDTAATYGKHIFIPSGTYKLNSGLTWQTSKHSIIGLGDVTFDYSAMPTGKAISLTGWGNLNPSYPHRASLHRLEGIRILGPDTDATTTDALYINDTAGLDQLLIRNVMLYGFRDQIIFDTNNWCIGFEKVSGGHFHRYGLNVLAGANAGENYHFFGCTWYSSHNANGNATAVYTTADGNADLYFYGCSFDYNDIEFDHNGGIVNTIGCHFEDSVSTGPMVYLSSTGGSAKTTFTASGGVFAPTEASPGRSHLIEHRAASTSGVFITLSGTAFATYDKNTSILKSLASVPPQFRIVGGSLDTGTNGNTAPAVSAVNSKLYNGDFEASAAFGTPGWSTANGGILTTCAIDTTSPRSGTRSLHVVGTGTAGQTTIAQYFAANPGDVINVRGFIKVGTYVSGLINLRLAWYLYDHTTRTTISNMKVANSATSGYVPFSAMVTVPPGVSFGYVDAQVDTFNGEAWVDDITVSSF